MVGGIVVTVLFIMESAKWEKKVGNVLPFYLKMVKNGEFYSDWLDANALTG